MTTTTVAINIMGTAGIASMNRTTAATSASSTPAPPPACGSEVPRIAPTGGVHRDRGDDREHEHADKPALQPPASRRQRRHRRSRRSDLRLYPAPTDFAPAPCPTGARQLLLTE